MSLIAFGGAEDGKGGLYVGIGGANDIIVTSPALAGSRSYQYDPKTPAGVTTQYGWNCNIAQTSVTRISVMCLFRFSAEFNATFNIIELNNQTLTGVAVRQLLLNTAEKLLLADDGANQIGATGDAYLAVNTTYPILYFYDQLNSLKTRDIVWVYKSGAWDKAIDVSNYGSTGAISGITFGSYKGKTAPTAGGLCYLDELCVQNFGDFPNVTALGSITTAVKSPTANGTDLDFTQGTGTSPDFNDVDEIPPDDATTYDAGDATNEKQSYVIANATASDVPLAVAVIGDMRNTDTSSPTSHKMKTYLFDGTTRDYSDEFAISQGIWQILKQGTKRMDFQTFNGTTWTEALFNSMEAGVLMTAHYDGQVQLSALHLEYVKTGPYALPSGFPTFPSLPITPPLGTAMRNTLLRR